MRRISPGLLAFAVLVSACDAVPPTEPPTEPPTDTAVITVASGSFFGSSSTQIFADGTLIGTTASDGKPPVRVVQQGGPGAYAKAAAVLAAEGAATKRAIKPHAQQCLDYGMDQVSATPPVAGFDQASSACPDAAMSALMSHVLATLSQP